VAEQCKGAIAENLKPVELSIDPTTMCPNNGRKFSQGRTGNAKRIEGV